METAPAGSVGTLSSWEGPLMRGGNAIHDRPASGAVPQTALIPPDVGEGECRDLTASSFGL